VHSSVVLRRRTSRQDDKVTGPPVHVKLYHIHVSCHCSTPPQHPAVEPQVKGSSSRRHDGALPANIAGSTGVVPLTLRARPADSVGTRSEGAGITPAIHTRQRSTHRGRVSATPQQAQTCPLRMTFVRDERWGGGELVRPSVLAPCVEERVGLTQTTGVSRWKWGVPWSQNKFVSTTGHRYALPRPRR
jgi:hypothetical protein